MYFEQSWKSALKLKGFRGFGGFNPDQERFAFWNWFHLTPCLKLHIICPHGPPWCTEPFRSQLVKESFNFTPTFDYILAWICVHGKATAGKRLESTFFILNRKQLNQRGRDILCFFFVLFLYIWEIKKIWKNVKCIQATTFDLWKKGFTKVIIFKQLSER